MTTIPRYANSRYPAHSDLLSLFRVIFARLAAVCYENGSLPRFICIYYVTPLRACRAFLYCRSLLIYINPNTQAKITGLYGAAIVAVHT
jgi:hypothetical protein